MKSSYSLDDLTLFVETARYGSLTQMAEKTGVPLSTVSRRLRRLDMQLGCRLMDRNAHQFRLTDAGRRYLAQCGPLLADLQSVGERLNEEHHHLRGSLRITAPVNLTQHWLGRCISAFMRAHPDIRIDLKLSNHYENLVESQFDAAFRVGEPALPDWIARHIWSSRMGLCAAPEYLERAAPIRHPQDLHAHRLIMATPLPTWQLRHRAGDTTVAFTPQPHLKVDDISIALNSARAGIGIAYVPSYYFENQTIAAQPLVPVLPEWLGDERKVYLLYRDREIMPARLRAFVDHVVAWEDCAAV